MRLIAVFLASVVMLQAQSQPQKSFVGTVAGFRPEKAEIEIETDSGDLVVGRITGDTISQQIAPGERDLKKATPIKAVDLSRGDRVLVTLETGATDIRRIVVMSVTDIARRDEADRADWQKRGVAGIVSAKSGKQLIVKNTTMGGSAETAITVSDQTTFKRYAPDSVKFSDAKSSGLAEISIGDQLRARGQKVEDGHSMSAQEVVFGSFVVKAGTITAVDLQANEVTIKELGTNKQLTVKFTGDSQLKQMPGMPMLGASGPGGMPAGSPLPGGPPESAGMTRGGGHAGAPTAPDFNQMLDHMPPATLEKMTPGSTIVVSSTKGSKSDQLTAIVAIANAEMLIQMASMRNGGRDGGPYGMGNPGMGAPMGGDLGGLAGLGFGGIIP